MTSTPVPIEPSGDAEGEPEPSGDDEGAIEASVEGGGDIEPWSMEAGADEPGADAAGVLEAAGVLDAGVLDAPAPGEAGVLALGEVRAPPEHAPTSMSPARTPAPILVIFIQRSLHVIWLSAMDADAREVARSQVYAQEPRFRFTGVALQTRCARSRRESPAVGNAV